MNEARLELAEVARQLSANGFHAGLAGNLSVRAGDNLLLCTAHGANKNALRLEDVVLCDLEGELLEGDQKPTSELFMHLAAYRARSDVGSVIHAHPPAATAFAATSTVLDTLQLPEMMVLLGPVAMVPYATPGTQDMALTLEPFLRSYDAFLLENHGALSLGCDLRQAAQRMELIEQNARITLMVRQLGPPFRLTNAQEHALKELRQKAIQC